MRSFILFSLWVGLPFIVSAFIMFTPLWISAPATLIFGLYWLGVTIAIGKE